MGRWSAEELAPLGGAFAYGDEAPRAKRLFQEGLGATEIDDLSLALGFPMLVVLGPDVDDPAAYARERLTQPLRRLDPWPRNAAARAARSLTCLWEIFPDRPMPEAEAALEVGGALEAAELPALLERFLALPTSAWRHTLELVFLLEALVGGEATLEAALGLVVSRVGEWTVIQSARRTFLFALGCVFDRLPEAKAGAARAQLEAVLADYRRVDPEISNPRRTGVATRVIDLVLHGPEGYVRSASRYEHGPDRNFDAFFLDRAAFVALTRPLGPLPPHTSASVQWLVQGGPAEVPDLGDWSKRTFQGSKEESQRYFVGEWGRVGTRESAALLVDLHARSLVKEDAMRLACRGAARLAPHVRAIADDPETAPRLKKAAKALLAAMRPG